MKKALPIEIMDYRELKENNYYVVDKSLMIKEFLNRMARVTLIARPRKFGKTLNLSMMAEFFDITKDSKQIFKDTKIMETEYANEMNQWPTIFISFSQVQGSEKEACQTIKNLFLNIYHKYEYLFHDMETMYEQPFYEHIMDHLINHPSDISFICFVFTFLLKMMEKYFGKTVMVFVDDFNKPMIEAQLHNYSKDFQLHYISLIRSTFKSSDSLKHGLLVDTFLVDNDYDLNSLVCTIEDKEFNDCFGFTEKETYDLLKYYDLELNQEVKKCMVDIILEKETFINHCR